jgi:hypothetical protein
LVLRPIRNSGQRPQVCSSTVPSGGKLDTKAVGKHVYVVQDGNVSATVDYAVIASCGRLSGAKLQRCQAQGAYFKALAACGPGTTPAARACAAKAKAAYKRSLAKSR